MRAAVGIRKMFYKNVTALVFVFSKQNLSNPRLFIICIYR